MNQSSRCPQCGKQKKPSFSLCYHCYQKKQKNSKRNLNPVTAKLQDMVKKRESIDQQNETEKKPRSIKDWINTEVKNWDKLITSNETEDFVSNDTANAENTYKRKQKKLNYF